MHLKTIKANQCPPRAGFILPVLAVLVNFQCERFK
jgi:hypothetical protein